MSEGGKDVRLGDLVLREGFERLWMVAGVRLGLGDETTIVDIESGKERTVKTSTLTVTKRPTWFPIA